MTPTRFPLQWPIDWPRTKPDARKNGTFRSDGKDLSVIKGVERVLAELERQGVHPDDVVVSTNLRTRLDGFPRSDQGRPGDPGVAVYWQAKGKPMRCLPIDRYSDVADNLAAIAATLEAMRAIERHGGGGVQERAYTAFAALPPPSGRRDWWTVLGLDATASADEIRDAYRRQASAAHPDKPGGSAERMAELNRARDEGLACC